jgi:hypothetical protein
MAKKKRKLISQRKRQRKLAAYTDAPTDKKGRKLSKYARKVLYLIREKTPDWGFLVPEPKPWK